jgi:pectinesterase
MSYEEAILSIWMDRTTSCHLLVHPPAYNVIVVKDGSGKYQTVNKAIQHAPHTGQKNANRYIIYEKARIYNEQITVPKKCTETTASRVGQEPRFTKTISTIATRKNNEV